MNKKFTSHNSVYLATAFSMLPKASAQISQKTIRFKIKSIPEEIRNFLQ